MITPTPLRYPGGKFKLNKYIEPLLINNGIDTYIEPFCGGAGLAIKLLKDGIVNNIVLNDYDYSIYCFWDAVLNNTDSLITKIVETQVNYEIWKEQKSIRNNFDKNNKLDIAFSTFFLNRTNRSGIIDKAGPIGGKEQAGVYKMDCRFNKTSLISDIESIAHMKDKISLYNMEAIDFIDIIKECDDKAFTFFDPPYYGKGPDLYTNFYSHSDHEKLSCAIKSKLLDKKWIVTYDNNNEIKKMYGFCDSMEYELQYTLQDKKHGSEIMFFSPSLIEYKK